MRHLVTDWVNDRGMEVNHGRAVLGKPALARGSTEL